MISTIHKINPPPSQLIVTKTNSNKWGITTGFGIIDSFHHLIFGSDYPHMDHKPNVVADMVALEGRLSKPVLQKILWDNPRRFYGLK